MQFRGMVPYEKLLVWQRAHALALDIYRVTEGWNDLPLRTQSRRSAVSVASNIVEGAASQSAAMFARFLSIALASAAELEYQLLFAHDNGSLSPASYAPLRQEVIELKKMIIALLKRIRATAARQRKGPPRDKREGPVQ